MSSGWLTLRQIVLDKRAEEKIDKLTVDLDRFQDAWEALEWLLARKPDVGVGKIVGTMRYCLYKQDSDPFAKTPAITVLYSFTDDQVTIHDIKAEKAADDT